MNTDQKKKDEIEDIPLSHLDSIMLRPIPDCRSNYVVRQLILQIENQNTFSGYIYDKLSTCENFFPESPALSRTDFIRIWKYCILQRSFDVRLRLTGKPAPSYLFFVKPASLPVPLAQLLKSLGSVRCPYTGLNVEIIPPPLDKKCLPLWALYNESSMNKWNKFMANISKYYSSIPDCENKHTTYGIFPDINDCKGKSICLTAKKVDHGKTSVRCASKIVKKSDLLIRVCHDELFVNPVYSYNDMFLEFPDKFDANSLRYDHLYYYYCRKK